MKFTTGASTSAKILYPHEVFVSFRGEDTRHNLIGHLFTALKSKNIVPFMDSEMMSKGESIGSELRRAIDLSQIYIVVFSKNYASSTWCLRELVEIIYFAQQYDKRVLPIFYHVDPSDVRHQKGTFAEAFIKHGENFGYDSKVVLRWKEVLTQVANLCGWTLSNHKLQHAMIENIVDEIVRILGHKSSSLPKDLVGMKSNLRELEKHLRLDLVDDVLAVGICEMRGIGKTTLAAVLSNKISHEFDVNCVIDDLSKIYREDGAIGAQKQIICQTLGKEYLEACNIPYKAVNLIQRRLHNLKTLIIFDNVDHVEQVETLGVNWDCLNAGSRIII